MMKTDFTTWPLHPRAVPEVAREHLSPAVLGVAAAVLYALSFFLPAFQEAAGYQAFFVSLFFVVGIPMWAANPVFWSGLVLLSQREYASAGKAGVLALSLALSECWLFSEGLRVGYFAWVGSMALLALAGGCGQPRDSFPIEAETAGEAARIASRLRHVPFRPLDGQAASTEAVEQGEHQGATPSSVVGAAP
jgi:hypothetical protein